MDEQKTFEERRFELEAQTGHDCGSVHTCAAKDQVLPMLNCMKGRLAAGTAARTWQSRANSEELVYVVDGTLIVIEQSYDAGAEWSERRCTNIGWHAAGDSCTTIEPYGCDGDL